MRPRFSRPGFGAPEPKGRASGPWVRVVEDRAIVTDARDTLAALTNAYLAAGRARVRPSFARLDGPATTGAVQLVASARSSTGAAVNFLAADGVLYAGTGAVPTTPIDLAGAVGGPITLADSAAARHVYAVSFADYLIVSDGVNPPFKVSLTTLAASLLGNFQEPAVGRPVVRSAKLFFIRQQKQTEIVWSEEGDPDLGYSGPCAGGGTYNNAWELRQTSQDALEALAATNDALLYWRGSDAGLVTGEVADDFQTNSTHDGISDTLGTRSPGAVLRVGTGRRVLFVDQRGRVCVADVGAGARQVSEPAVTIGTVQRAALPDVLAATVPGLGLVLVAHPLGGPQGGDGTTGPTTWLVFDPEGPDGEVVYHGRWTWPEVSAGVSRQIRALGVWLLADREDVETLVVGDDQGLAWALLAPLPPLHVDYTGVPDANGPTAPVAFTRTLRPGAMLAAPLAVKRFDQITAEVCDPPETASGSALAGALTLDYVTSRGANADGAQAVAPAGAGSGELGRALVGIDGTGHWIAPLVTTTGDPTAGPETAYDLVRVTVDGCVLGTQPEYGESGDEAA